MSAAFKEIPLLSINGAALKFFLDDLLIGGLVSADAKLLQNLDLKIALGTWSPGNTTMVALIDDVVLAGAK